MEGISDGKRVQPNFRSRKIERGRALKKEKKGSESLKRLVAQS